MSLSATRWWENYLVRYFMPSIAGIVAIRWLVAASGAETAELLGLPQNSETLSSTSLLLLVLYGNLFCYVASYPILVFHSTRVIDFATNENRWQIGWLTPDGYYATAILGIAVVLTFLAPSKVGCVLSFLLCVAYSAVQMLRLRRAIRPRRKADGLDEPASPMFVLAYSLARRRGMRQETRTGVPPDVSNADLDDGSSVQTSTSVVHEWRSEFVDTYRHLREHGNSAFIFALELVLAGLVYNVISVAGMNGFQKISSVAILLGVWALPAIFVHLAGQHMERRFSQVDRRWR